MATSRVAIIGTGLIGTSIGLGLREHARDRFEVVGADRDRSNAKSAKKLGAIDREVGSLEEAVEGAAIVVIAVPVLAARHIMKEMGPYLGQGTIVTDTCSTKADMMRWAKEFLPRGVDFVGGHPMAGKEQSGPSAGEATLFKNATWAVTPSTSARERSVSVVLGLVEALGATPVHIDAEEHDQYAAAISHLPLVVSTALFRMVRDSAGWEDASLMAGPGFRDVTRLASGDPTMAADIVDTNKEAVLHWLRRYRQELYNLEDAIEAGDDAVRNFFASTQLDRDAWLENPRAARTPQGVSAPSAQDTLGQFLVGGRAYDRLKEITSTTPGMSSEQDAKLRRELGAEDDDEDRRRGR